MATELDPILHSKILDLRMQSNDADATTVREYLVELLFTLWRQGEDFSSKRPFGNSGWQYDLLITLVTAGIITGKLDGDGYLEEVDDEAGHRLILSAISHL